MSIMSARGTMNNPYCSNDCSHCSIKTSLSFLKCKHGFCRKCLTAVNNKHSCLICDGSSDVVQDYQKTALKLLDESYVQGIESAEMTALRNSAIFWFKQTLFQNSRTPKIHSKLCPLLIETKDYEQSVYYLYDGVKLYPEEYALWYSLSCVFLTVGNPFSAAEYLTAAVGTLEESPDCTSELLSKYKEALVVIVQIVTETGLVDKFRFKIGDTVEYNVDDGKGCGTSMWKKGRIEGLFYRECDWPLKKIVPYQMLDLDSCCCFDNNCKMRRYAYCNYDIKDCMVPMPYQTTTTDNLRQYQLVVGKSELLNLVQKRVSREDFVWFQSVYDVYFDNLMTFTVPLVDRAVVNSSSSMLQYIALRVVTVIPAASEEYFLARLAANTLDPEGKLLLIERNTLVACQYDHSLTVRFSETNIQLYRQAAVSGNFEAITALCMYLFSQIMTKIEPERPFSNYLAPLGDHINAVRNTPEMVEMWEKLIRLAEANHVSWFLILRAVELRANFYLQLEDSIEGILERHDEGAFTALKELQTPQPIVREFLWCNNPFCYGSTYRGCKWSDCERCRKVKYCSKECQAAHSKKHKKKCKDIKAVNGVSEDSISSSAASGLLNLSGGGGGKNGSATSTGSGSSPSGSAASSASSYSLKSTGSGDLSNGLGAMKLNGVTNGSGKTSPSSTTFFPSSSSASLNGTASSRALPTAPANEHTAPLLRRESLPVTSENSSRWMSFMQQTLRRESLTNSGGSSSVKYVQYKNISSISTLRADAAEFIKQNKHARAAKCYTMIIHNMFNSRFWEDSSTYTQHKCDECAHAVLERIKCHAKLANDQKSLRITEQLIADIVNMLRNSLFERMRVNNGGIVKLLNSLFERSVKFQKHLITLHNKSQQAVAKTTVLTAAKRSESYDIQVVRCQVVVDFKYATNALQSEDFCPMCHVAWNEFQTTHDYAVVLPCTHAVCVCCLSRYFKECQTHNKLHCSQATHNLQAATPPQTPSIDASEGTATSASSPTDTPPPPPLSPAVTVDTVVDQGAASTPVTTPVATPQMKFSCRLCQEVICADVVNELATGMIAQRETNVFAEMMGELLLLNKTEQDAVLRALLVMQCFDFSVVETILFTFVGLIYYADSFTTSIVNTRMSSSSRQSLITSTLSASLHSLERDFASTSSWIYCTLNTSTANQEYGVLKERLADLESQIHSARSGVVQTLAEELHLEVRRKSVAESEEQTAHSTSSTTVSSDDSGTTTDDVKEVIDTATEESVTQYVNEEEVNRERVVDLSGLTTEEVHNTLTYFIVPLLKVCKSLLLCGECFQGDVLLTSIVDIDNTDTTSIVNDSSVSHFLFNKHIRFEVIPPNELTPQMLRVTYLTPEEVLSAAGAAESVAKEVN